MRNFNLYLIYFSPIILALFLLIVGSLPASSQSVLNCAPQGLIEGFLTDNYDERLRREIEAPHLPGGIVQLWTNPTTGTFTLLMFPDARTTCLLSTGQDDRFIELMT